MSIMRYAKDKLPAFMLNLLCMVLLSLFLLSTGSTFDTVFLITAIWLAIVISYFTASFLVRRRYLGNLIEMSENIDEKYLISEIMEKPSRIDDEVFYRLLKSADRAMLEKISEIKQESQDYKEYIEQWVHEAKTPITAMRLICENNRESIPKALNAELEKLNNYVEQALFFARSEYTQRDYLIREIRLEDIVHQAIAQNRQLLMQNNVRLEVDSSELTAYTDEKWITFILSQLLQNAVKYKSDTPVIKFDIWQEDNRTMLSITDNGIGIESDALPRIFEKGFTGQNGRENTYATGIGLYLCKRLCDRLQVGLEAASEGSSCTTFTLIFNHNYFVINK